MHYSIKDALMLTSDLQAFPHDEDTLDSILENYSSCELEIDELEMIAAARLNTQLSFSEFTASVIKSKKTH